MEYSDFLKEWKNNLPYITVHTSGSTGDPKEIKLDKAFVKESALRTINFFGLTPGSRLHSCVSPDFIGGKMMMVRAEILGCKFTWETPSNKSLTDIGPEEKITLLSVVPSQMIFLLDHPELLSQVETFLIGGSRISQILRKKILDSGVNAYETYGMTETASHIALRKIESEEKPFETLKNIEINKDERGCLEIIFENGTKISTTDICELAGPGKFYILGRADNVINSGGKKINIEFLENRIEELLGFPVRVYGAPDEKWGERIEMEIEERNVGRWKEKEALLKENLVSWMVPKAIKTVKKFNLTANGKIKRR